jgi:HEAT repeat protein
MKKFNKVLGALGIACLLALPSLAQAGTGGSYATMKNAINSGNSSAIIAAIERTEKLPCGSCIDLVTPLIDDERKEVRDVAAWWLAKRAIREQVRDQMFERLLSGDTIAARNASEVLGRFAHPDALEALEIAIHDNSLGDEARVAAAEAIASIGHRDGKSVLEAALTSESAAVRAAAADALRGIRGNVEGLALVDALNDESPMVLQAAARSLGTMEEVAAVEPLLDVAADESLPDQVRIDAAWALGQIGDSSVADDLEVIAESASNSLVRSSARVAYHKVIAQ